MLDTKSTGWMLVSAGERVRDSNSQHDDNLFNTVCGCSWTSHSFDSQIAFVDFDVDDEVAQSKTATWQESQFDQVLPLICTVSVGLRRRRDVDGDADVIMG
jgi:hypothetical protein